MSRFTRGEREPTVPGRALVVPGSTANIGTGEEENANTFSHRGKARSLAGLVALSAADGHPVRPGQQTVTAWLPNWMRMVMHDAGTSHGGAEHLPRQLHVPVFIDQAERTIAALDVDGAATELERYREIGRREWKETEAVAAPVRAAAALPGAAVRGVRGFLSSWTGTVAEFREDLTTGNSPDRPLSDKELEQRRATARALRTTFEQDPKAHLQARDTALKHGPTMARGAAAGSYPPSHFDAWVEFQELSTAITAEEAAQFRLIAATPPSHDAA